MTPEELKALGCQDCPAVLRINKHVQRRDDGMMHRTLAVEVTHDSTCPWAAANLPEGEQTWVKPTGTVRHIRSTDP